MVELPVTAVPPAEPGRGRAAKGLAQLAELEDERAFLLRSIEDLDAEWQAGDIAETDYRALRDRYTARAAEVLRSIEVGQPGDAPSADAAPQAPAPTAPDDADPVTGSGDGSRRRRRRRALVWGAVALFAAAACVLVVAEVTARLPGQSSSGSLDLSSAQKLARTLAQAQTLENEGKAAQALALYHQILAQDPGQEQALAETGWLEFEAGVLSTKSSLLSSGQAEEQKAEVSDPSAYAPHLYLGSMLLVEGQASQAADQYTQFLADHPPVAEEQSAWPYVVKAFSQAGRPAPPVPAGVHG